MEGLPKVAPFDNKGRLDLKLKMALLIEFHENNPMEFASMVQYFHHILNYLQPTSKPLLLS